MISWLLFLGHLSKITCDGQLMFIVRTPGNASTKAIVDVHCKLGSVSCELILCQFCWDEQTQLSNDRGFEVISCRIIGLMVLTMLIRIVIITMTVMVSHMWIVTSTSLSKLSTIFSASFKHFLAQLRFHHWLHTKWFGQAGIFSCSYLRIVCVVELFELFEWWQKKYGQESRILWIFGNLRQPWFILHKLSTSLSRLRL